MSSVFSKIFFSIFWIGKSESRQFFRCIGHLLRRDNCSAAPMLSDRAHDRCSFRIANFSKRQEVPKALFFFQAGDAFARHPIPFPHRYPSTLILQFFGDLFFSPSFFWSFFPKNKCNKSFVSPRFGTGSFPAQNDKEQVFCIGETGSSWYE